MSAGDKGINSEMTFWDHLRELRGNLLRSAGAVLILSTVAFFLKDFLFNQVILAPKSADFITNRLLCALGRWLADNTGLISPASLCIGDFDLKIININLAGQFLMHLYIAFFTGLFLSVPYIVYEIWKFIRPALYARERKYASIAVIWISVLFLVGVLFSYFFIVPLTILFLGNYSISEAVENQIALTSYVSTVIILTLSVGLVFELPVFIYFLTKVGLITPEILRKNRRIMVVVVFILAAIITPPDIVSQILVALPLLVLYEISILVSKRVSIQSNS